MPRYFSDIVFMKHNNYTSLFYLHKNALENGHAHAFSGFNQNKKCIPVNLFNELHMRAIMPKDILKMKGISTVGRIYWRHYTRICITYPQRSRNITKCGKECIFSCEFNTRNTSSKCSECQKYQTTSEKLSRAISFHLFFQIKFINVFSFNQRVQQTGTGRSHSSILRLTETEITKNAFWKSIFRFFLLIIIFGNRLLILAAQEYHSLHSNENFSG